MSLLRLLSVGKCLNAENAASGRYQLGQYMLPKFGNRVCEPVRRASAPTAAHVVPASAAIPKFGAKAAEIQPVVSPTTAAEISGVPAVSGANPFASGATGRTGVGARVVGWFRSIKKRLWRAPAKAAVKPAGVSPIQGELSLDNVKVMRNDLSDADLELVPARKASAPGVVQPTLFERAAGRKPAGAVLGRLTARIFDTGKPRF